METLLAEIGKKLTSFNPELIKPNSCKKERKILHICSEVYTTGGHTKLLYNWVQNDVTSQHTILSTRMDMSAINAVSKRYLGQEIAKHVCLPQEDHLRRAQALKDQLYENYDLVVLHIHPDDSLCNLVFSDPKITIQIAFVNHADHVFWLGSTISTILVQLRKPFLILDVERRQIEKSFYIPLPIVEAPLTAPTEQDSFSTTQADEVVILCIGSEVKFEPNEKYNFYEECIRIVEKHKNVRIKLIGVSKEGKYAIKHQHERIDYLGLLDYEDLEKYRSSCDIYLEGFPMPSFTATLETVFFKKPAILHYNPTPIFQQFMDSDIGFQYPSNLNEWRLAVDRVILDKDYRDYLAEIQYGFVIHNYSMNAWRTKLQLFYKDFLSLTPICKSFVQNEYNGDNEIALVKLSNTTIDHLYLTDKLSFSSKIKMVFFQSPVIKKKTSKTPISRKISYFTPSFIKNFIKNVVGLISKPT
ncbi:MULTISPECIES: glycosyltransferase [Sphingobacterium]|uniref:Glycosyltransferase n=1 Tax=Sphingobacterium populi TaxID=1812824 RepID=A0ABW5UBC5_9SPHI|nr:glycosyltransferase [Sphingobacterium sp. CFCC 11742]